MPALRAIPRRASGPSSGAPRGAPRRATGIASGNTRRPRARPARRARSGVPRSRMTLPARTVCASVCPADQRCSRRRPSRDGQRIDAPVTDRRQQLLDSFGEAPIRAVDRERARVLLRGTACWRRTTASLYASSRANELAPPSNDPSTREEFGGSIGEPRVLPGRRLAPRTMCWRAQGCWRWYETASLLVWPSTATTSGRPSPLTSPTVNMLEPMTPMKANA